MQHALAVMVILGLFVALSAGCTTISPPIPTGVEGNGQALRMGDIIDTKTGKTVSFDSLMAELSQARVIYVGETHTSVEDHQVQQKIGEQLYAMNNSLALAMEMFPRNAQPILDQYSSGNLSEEAFLREVNWEKVWGYPFQLYRSLLSFASERNLKLIGLNVPHEVVRKISRNGLSALSNEERSQVASGINFDDPEHRNHIAASL